MCSLAALDRAAQADMFAKRELALKPRCALSGREVTCRISLDESNRTLDVITWGQRAAVAQHMPRVLHEIAACIERQAFGALAKGVKSNLFLCCRCIRDEKVLAPQVVSVVVSQAATSGGDAKHAYTDLDDVSCAVHGFVSGADHLLSESKKDTVSLQPSNVISWSPKQLLDEITSRSPGLRKFFQTGTINGKLFLTLERESLIALGLRHDSHFVLAAELRLEMQAQQAEFERLAALSRMPLCHTKAHRTVFSITGGQGDDNRFQGALGSQIARTATREVCYFSRQVATSAGRDQGAPQADRRVGTAYYVVSPFS